MNPLPAIECKPNGPYLVKNLERLKDADGKPIPTEAAIALCRCGGSANKPFCDGTHRKNGFSDEKLADGGADKRDSYAGKGITIHDNRSLCAHAGHCTDGLKAVFKYRQEPWIDPHGATVEAIVETIRRCPSGALSYVLEGEAGPEEKGAPSITVTRDGPYAVAGAVDCPGQVWGRGADRRRFTLCRCGASRNKPFCDGTHWSVGFKDPPG